LDIGQDVVAGTKVEVQELGSQARNFNPEQFTDLTIGPIFKALNDFRGKQGSSESHQYANARSSAALDEIGLSSFPIAIKEQLNEKLFRPWYETHPLPDPRTGGLTYTSWHDLKFSIEFGKVEKKDLPVQDHIKLLELYINSPLPKDPVELRTLFEQAGLGLTKNIDDQLRQMFSPEQLAMNQMMAQTGINPSEPQQAKPDNWDNQNVGSPPMDNPNFDSMAISVRGDMQNNYKRTGQNQDYETGRNYEK
jgi:hypothetical protein